MAEIKDLNFERDAELHVKKLQLHWLLQITKAINYNMPSNQLFEIYERVMKDHLKVEKLLLYVHEDKWRNMLSYGVIHDNILEAVEQKLADINELQLNDVNLPEWVQGFDSIIPVFHDNKPLAYAFIGELHHDEIASLKEILPFIHTITNIIVVAIENKRLTRDTIKQAQLEKELELAARMQNMLFPAHLPTNGKIDLAATYLPHQMIGGDYYDYIELSQDELLICLADVSGKGISAALLMSNFQANLHAKAIAGKSLVELTKELNECVNKSAKGEKFITVFLAIINTKQNKIEYINAGHNPPFLFCNDAHQLLETGTTGLGMFEELPFVNCDVVDFPKNSILFCYTDGVVEQENQMNDLFGMDVLCELIKNNSDAFTMKDLHFRIVDAFKSFKKDADAIDDVTLLSCRIS